MPEGLDHSHFGEPLPTRQLVEMPAKEPIARIVGAFPDTSYPAAVWHRRTDQVEAAVPKHLQACDATYRFAISGPLDVTAFLPDQAAFVQRGAERFLIEESTWHTGIFYSRWFRCDRSTNWQWRIDQSWTANEVIERPVNFCYHHFLYQYFHWFIDILPRIWILKKYPPTSQRHAWYIGPLDQPFQIPSLRLLNVSPAECISPTGPVVRMTQAIVPAFTFSEPHKLRPSYDLGIHHKGWSEEYVCDMRDRSRFVYGKPTQSTPQRIYVARTRGAHRKVRNEYDLVGLLSRYGFAMIDPGAHTFEDQVRIFSGARIIAGVHGAGMTNIIWAQPGCRILEFMPQELDDIGYRLLAPMAGHDYNVVLCRQFPHPSGIAYADIEVDLTAAEHALTALVN